MLEWRKKEDSNFSIRQELGQIRGLSPSLVSQVIRKSRRVTRDRSAAFAKLLSLNRQETLLFDRWIALERMPFDAEKSKSEVLLPRKREAQNHLFKNWLNVYVKDASLLKDFKPDPKYLERRLGNIADAQRIKNSL